MSTNFYKKSPPCIKISREFNVYIREQSELIQSQLQDQRKGPKSKRGEMMTLGGQIKPKAKSKMNFNSRSISSREKSFVQQPNQTIEGSSPLRLDHFLLKNPKMAQIMKKIEKFKHDGEFVDNLLDFLSKAKNESSKISHQNSIQDNLLRTTVTSTQQPQNFLELSLSSHQVDNPKNTFTDYQANLSGRKLLAQRKLSLNKKEQIPNSRFSLTQNDKFSPGNSVSFQRTKGLSSRL